MTISERVRVFPLAWAWRAGLCLGCCGLPAAPLFGQRTPIRQEELAGFAVQEELWARLTDFAQSWCAGEALAPIFDVERSRAEIWRGLRELDLRSLPPPLDLSEAFGRCLSPELRGRRTGFEILGLQFGAEPREATAYLRFVGTDGAKGDLRLCLTQAGSSWKIWDLEELDAGLGLVDVEVIVRSELWRDPRRGKEFLLWIRQLQRMVLAEERYQRSDLPRILKYRSRFPAAPARIEAFWQVCEAVVARDEGENGRAVELLERAAKTRGDRPRQAQMLARALLSEQRHAEAVEAIDGWQAMVGIDVESEHLRGRVREAQGSRTAALAAYRRALELEEHHLGCLAGLVRLLPAGECDEVVRALRSHPDPFRAFAGIESELAAEGAWESVSRLTRLLLDLDDANLEWILQRAYQVADPRSPSPRRSGGSRLWMIRGGSEIFALLHPCLPELTRSVQEERWRDLYLRAAFWALRSSEAYESLPRSGETFETLARSWLRVRPLPDEASWRALLDRRERDDPGDPLLLACRGLLLLNAGERAAAEQLFARADEAGVPALTNGFTEWRVENLYHLGRAREALEEIQPSERVFDVLLGIGLFENDAPLLRLLAETRQARQPLDPEPTLWLAHAEFLDGHHQECLRLLAVGEASPAAWEKGDSVYVDDRFRSLLRLHRFEEAMAVAVSWSAEWESDWYELVVHGVRGEHDEVLKGLEEHLEYGPEEVWNDPDFGPIFAAAPEYAALREKYPRQ